jgi:hypothetical protein
MPIEGLAAEESSGSTRTDVAMSCQHRAPQHRDGCTLPEMTAQHRGWPHNDWDDGEYVPHVIHAATLPGVRAWPPLVHLSRVPLCPFEGLAVGGGRE